MKRSWLAFFLALSFLVAGVREVKDIPYIDDSNAKHRLDLYLPEGSGFPVLIFVHGGAWVRGDKARPQFVKFARSFAREGVGVVLPTYRLFPQTDINGMARDVAAALSWVVRNIARYKGNANCILVGGHSAGAHLTALVLSDSRWLESYGLKPRRFSGLIAWSGVYDLTRRPPARRRHRRFGDRLFGSSPEQRKEVSPLFHVNSQMPPVLILYSTAQGPFFTRQAEAFYKKLKEAGVDVEIKDLKSTRHGTEVMEAALAGSQAHREIINFIRKCCPGWR